MMRRGDGAQSLAALWCHQALLFLKTRKPSASRLQRKPDRLKFQQRIPYTVSPSRPMAFRLKTEIDDAPDHRRSFSTHIVAEQVVSKKRDRGPSQDLFELRITVTVLDCT